MIVGLGHGIEWGGEECVVLLIGGGGEMYELRL